MDWKKNIDIIKVMPVIVLFIFAYQLGQFNVHATEQLIQDYCPSNVNYSVAWSGQVGLWKDKPNINDSVFDGRAVINGTG